MAISFIASNSPTLTYADQASQAPGTVHTCSVRFLLNVANTISGNDRTIIGKGLSLGAFAINWGLFEADKLFCIIGGAGDYATVYELASSSLGLSTDTWFDVLVTYDGALSADDRIRFYVNGSDVGGLHRSTYDADAEVQNTTDVLEIGHRGAGSYLGASGESVRLAEMAVWSTALSAANATTLYNSGVFKAASEIPTGLGFHDHMVSIATLQDVINSVTPTTATGLVDSTHPTMDGGGGGGAIPVKLAQYRQRRS